MDVKPYDSATTASPQELSGDKYRANGMFEQAIGVYLEVATYPAPASLCLSLARCYEQIADYVEACRWALPVVDAGDDFTSWQKAWTQFRRVSLKAERPKAITIRVALLGSYTTMQFGDMFCLAASRLGITVDLYKSDYGQLEQEIIDSHSGLYTFQPEMVLLVVHERELHLPEYSTRPAEDVQQEVRRWTALWRVIKDRSGARIIQHNFALPCEIPTGHLAARLPDLDI